MENRSEDIFQSYLMMKYDHRPSTAEGIVKIALDIAALIQAEREKAIKVVKNGEESAS